jgi:hypothetical protein
MPSISDDRGHDWFWGATTGARWSFNTEAVVRNGAGSGF